MDLVRTGNREGFRGQKECTLVFRVRVWGKSKELGESDGINYLLYAWSLASPFPQRKKSVFPDGLGISLSPGLPTPPHLKIEPGVQMRTLYKGSPSCKSKAK